MADTAEFKRRILILYAHPAQTRSLVNRTLFTAAHGIDGVTAVDLYGEYPRMDIDIDREQQRLRDHDVIIFQHPFYWYSTPAILKEWQDLVLEYGFAYGEGGTALNGKIFFNALTTGGPEKAYTPEGYNRFTLRELLQPLEQTARLCAMAYLPPFALHGARHASEDGRANDHLTAWIDLLKALRDDRLDIDTAQNLPRLNDGLDTLIAKD